MFKKHYLNKIKRITTATTIVMILLMVGLLSFSSLALAVFNAEINYQGKLTDSAGTAVADEDYNMEFKIYTVSTEGSAIWTETLTSANKVTVTDGLFSVLLGEVTDISGVDFNQDLYLGINIGGTGTASWDGEMTPRKQLAAVPSAFEADKLDGQEGSYYLDADNLTDFGNPFYTYLNATTTDALTEGSTNKYWSNILFDNRLSATTTLPDLTTLLGLTNATTTQLTSTNSWLGNTLITANTISATNNSGVNIYDNAGGGLSVEDGGNIGIGTTDPSQMLDVMGSIRATGDICTDGGYCLETIGARGSDNLGNHTAAQNINLATYKLVGEGGTVGVYIDSSGNTGIGTTTPESFLTVGGTMGVGTNGTEFTINSNGVVGAGTWNGTALTDAYVSDALTVTGYMEDADINTFSKLQSWVSDATILDTAQINTISKFNAILTGESVASTTWSGATSLTTLGTVGTGTWQATDIGVEYGGTGVSTLTDHGVLIGSGTGALTPLTVGTNGQLLVGSTGADPVFATMTAGDNLSLTAGAGTIELDVDDAFLVNDASDTTTGTITSAGFIVADGQTVGAATNKWLFDDSNNDVTTTGNVGIGVTDPDVALEIYKAGTQLKLSYDATNNASIAVNSAGGLSMVPAVTNATTTIGAGDEALRIDSAGNVGIGTSAPVYQLQLSTNSAAKPGTAYWTVASDERLKDVNGDFTRGLDALDGLYPVYFNYKVGNAQNIPYDREYIGLIAQDVREVIPEAVVENQDGYLAIETDPILWTMLNSIKELALKVGSDTISYTKENVEVINDSGEAQLKLAYDEENLAEFKVSAVGDLSINTAGKDVRLLDDNMSVCSGEACPLEASLIDGTGNLVVENVAYVAGALGIGTAQPQRRVDIYETQSDPQLRISYDDDLYSEFNVSATGDLSISTKGGDISILNENLKVCSDEGCPNEFSQLQNTGNLVVENSLLALGNVGIGTVSPDYTLDVKGTLRAYGITDASDIRLKTNIKSLSQNSDVLNNIQKLRGVTFEWRNQDFGTGTQIGLIAQEVEKVYPELVSTDKDGYKSVQYAKITAVIIEAIKGLLNKDSQLEAENILLNNRVKALEDVLLK